MLPLKTISGLRVVELLHAAWPADQAEITACVLRMTSRAIGLAVLAVHNLRVEALVVFEPLAYLRMTRQAFQSGRTSTERVA
jgi:hypothetical protein